jgi:microcystin-dependent protein
MDAFIGEIRLMAISYTPQNWLPCDGRQVSFQQYQVLYAVIGNRFGGTPGQNFNLPDLRARVAVGAGNDPIDTFDPVFATSGGVNTVTLTSSNIPSHTHALIGAATGAANRVATGQGNWLSTPVSIPTTGANESANAFIPDATTGTPATLNGGSLSPYPGKGLPHENRQPFLAVQYFICVDGGEFPVHP